MTTWGPTPQSVVDLQTMGPNAWLAAQFATPASAWPDPDSTTEGVARLQTAFFNVAINGSDQLRQRASFALAQILVASAVKDMQFEQMVAYQRLHGRLRLRHLPRPAGRHHPESRHGLLPRHGEQRQGQPRYRHGG